MLKLLMIMGLFIISLSAEPTMSEVITQVKQNPALLDTPQAKSEMSKRGLDKGDVLSKINSTQDSQNEALTKEDSVENEVEAKDTAEAEIVDSEKDLTSDSIYTNPFEYQDNNSFLKNAKLSQSIKTDENLKRFGITFFKNKNNINLSSISVPDYYIISKSDVLSIWIYGTKNEQHSLQVDNNGNINIPNIGPLSVVGKEFSNVKALIKKRLGTSYPNTSISVNIEKYSTIQVNLVGEVDAPGVYNINALSTIKNLLIQANSVKETGSLRNIMIKRDGNTIAVIDFYKLLKNGDNSFNIILKPNDVIFIPKAKKIVSINGEITNRAKFELKSHEKLSDLIKYAGNLKYSSSKHSFIVKRFIANQKTKTIEVDFNDASKFEVFDGDYVYIYKIDKLHKNSIYFDGNFVRPGERELINNGSLSKILNDEISKLSLKGVFLSDTLFEYGLIKRDGKELNKKILSFNLMDVIQGKNDIQLLNNDQVYVFNKFNSNLVPFVSINGTPVQNGGKYKYYEGMKISDIINIAGSTPYSKVKVTTYNTDDLMPKIFFADINYNLSPFDAVEIFDYYMFNNIKSFKISGEVNLPNTYTINKEMSFSDAVEIAGGFTEKAFLSSYELVRYNIVYNERVKSVISVEKEDIDTIKLQAYDEIKVFKIPNWNESNVVTIHGEVKFPGEYIINKSDKISDIIKRAGGYTKDAFFEGSIFTREDVKKVEQKSIEDSIKKLKKNVSIIALSPAEAGETAQDKKALMTLVNSLIEDLKETKPVGRLAIQLSKDLEDFENSYYNIYLNDKDTIYIPRKNQTISVVGEVYSANTFIYLPNQDMDFYLNKSGGLTDDADIENIYIIHPNGDVQKYDAGFLFDTEMSLSAGDTLVVPLKIETASNIGITKDIAEILYKIAITAASLKAIGSI